MECGDTRWGIWDLWDGILLRFGKPLLILEPGELLQDLCELAIWWVLDKEWVREAAADQGGVETICRGGDVAKELTGIDGEAATDEWHDSKAAVDDGDGAPQESRGVDSEAGGMLVVILASRLHTGQNDLHAVSQESTQIAWNSGKQFKALCQ